MRHCCDFDASDIWYLKNTEKYVQRLIFIGHCPICGKLTVLLNQKNVKSGVFLSVKKIGETATALLKENKPFVINSNSKSNKQKFKPTTYGWKYGVNRSKNDGSGNIILEQYAADFNGNYELIKKKKIL